jgi:hypothetical protein
MHQIPVSKPWRNFIGGEKKKKAAAFGYGFAMTSKLKINNVHKIRPFAKFSHKTTHSLTHSLPAVPNKCHLARKKRIRV